MFPIVETINAGEVLEIAASGRYLEIVDLTGGVDIRLTTREGREVASGRAVLIGSFFNTKDQFETITITNVSGAQTTIRAFYGDGQAGSRRTSGSVSVTGGVLTDESNTNVLAGRKFGAYNSLVVGAGQIACIQVWNPAGSQRTLMLEHLEMRCSVAATALVWRSQTVGAALVSNLSNYYAGRPVSVSELRTNVGTLGPANELHTIPANVWTPRGAKYSKIVVPPGWGIFASSGTLAAGGTFEAIFNVTENPI